MVSCMKYELWTILMAWKYVSCEVLSFMLKSLLPYYDKGTSSIAFLIMILCWPNIQENFYNEDVCMGTMYL